MDFPQSSNTGSVAFVILANQGDFHGVPGAGPAVMLQKGTAQPVPAFGQVIDTGGGTYRLVGDARDRDVVGEVVLLVQAPSGDIAPFGAYVVTQPSLWSLLASVPQNIASMANNLRLLAQSSIPSQSQGQIQ